MKKRLRSCATTDASQTRKKRLGVALSQFIADLRAIEAGKQAWANQGYPSNEYAG